MRLHARGRREYAPEESVAVDEAELYHSKQIGWLVETEVDMVTALTFTQSDEAIGVVRAAKAAWRHCHVNRIDSEIVVTRRWSPYAFSMT